MAGVRNGKTADVCQCALAAAASRQGRMRYRLRPLRRAASSEPRTVGIRSGIDGPWSSVRAHLSLGGETFVERLESLGGRVLEPEKRGPRRRGQPIQLCVPPWDPAARRPYRGYPKRQLPMWHVYRVELYPHFGQLCGIRDERGHELEFPSAFRRSRAGGRPRGIVKIAGGGS